MAAHLQLLVALRLSSSAAEQPQVCGQPKIASVRAAAQPALCPAEQ